MNIELISQIADILACLFAFLALLGIGITVKKVNKLTNKNSVNVSGDVAGDINLLNQALEKEQIK